MLGRYLPFATMDGMSGQASDITANLVKRDSAAVWHPFTQQSLWADDDPIVVDRAEGMYFWDTDGNRYLDGVSSLWVNVHGHRVPEIDDAIKRQLDRLDHTTFLGLTHAPGIELAERLIDTAPMGLTRVFYAGDGSSAVEAALKMAYQAHVQRGEQRPFYLHVAEGYHGDTLGSVSVGGIDLFHEKYHPILLSTQMVSSPGLLEPGQTRAERAIAVIAELRDKLVEHGDQISALVIEPMVQGAGGMLTHDVSFVRGARELCDEFGVLLICDEVATGIGRTGKMWAVEHADIRPDMITCGKGVTGGYLPLSAVLVAEPVYDAFLGSATSGRTFYHGHSYTANPLACAAAIANLDLMAQRNTVAHAADVGEQLAEQLAPLLTVPGVREIRQIGTMTGIEVDPVTERTGFAICQHARRNGVWVRPLGDVVVLMPPLAIEAADLNLLTNTVTDAITTVLA